MKKILLSLGIIALAIATLVIATPDRLEEIGNTAAADVSQTLKSAENGGYKFYSSEDLSISFLIPDLWQTAEQNGDLAVVDEEGETNVYIEVFSSNDFQKPEGTNILSRKDITINGRAAVSYVISNSKTNDTTPQWLSETYKTVDIREHEEDPSRFFVFAKNPFLSESEFERFLNSVVFE